MARRRARPHVLFFLVGGLLLIVSYLVTPKDKRTDFWTSTLQNLALIALTVVVVDGIWSIVGGDPVAELRDMLEQLRESTKLLDDSHKTGLRRVLAASGAWGSSDDWMERLKSARSGVDVMGYTLHVLTKGRDFESVIADLVARGVRVRFLVMATDNPHLAAFVNSTQIPGLSISAVREELVAAISAFQALANSLQSQNFQVHILKSGLIVSQIFRVDGSITSIQYLYSEVASRNPILEVHGESSDLFQCYTKEFERVWRLSQTV